MSASPPLALHGLRLVVTFTGACVLVIEVLATRILAPHFGSTLPTLSSVLGVTLGALSAGYSVGGMIADKPRWGFFFSLIALSGVATVLIWPLTIVLLPTLGEELGPLSGPLLSSLLLFALPCTLLGTLSPYAVGLVKTASPELSAARAAGQIFFWSTLGSIGGSLLAGFVLIPAAGVRMLLVLVGACLLALGTAGMLHRTAAQSGARSVAFLPLLLALPLALWPQGNRAFVYQRIAVQDIAQPIGTLRLLWQDRNASSAVYLENEELAFDYTRVPAVAWTGRTPPARSLVVGAGAFVIPRTIVAASPTGTVDVVDIEPGLQEIARRFFRFVPSESIRSAVSDGRRWLKRAGPYDLIVLDAYSAHYAIPVHLTTREFFVLVRERLTDQGIVVGNFIGIPDPTQETYLPSAMRTFRTAFPEARFYSMNAPNGTQLRNVLFIACKEATCVDPCSPDLLSSDDPILASLCTREIAVEDAALSKHSLLTDDYAPVEWLTSGSEL
jgi:predicted membrane-bound spermidine synthase